MHSEPDHSAEVNRGNAPAAAPDVPGAAAAEGGGVATPAAPDTAGAHAAAPDTTAAHAAAPDVTQATATQGGVPTPTPAPAPEPGASPAECGARLAALFPALFVAPGAPGPAKPIKLRIHTDIQARAPRLFSKRVLGIFFSRYTTTNAYLKALAAPGAQRFDLDGQPAGDIAEEHRAAAAEELARRHAIAAERRAAQRPQRAPIPSRGDEAAPERGAAHAEPKGTPPDRRPRTDRPRPPRPPRGDRREGDARSGRPAPRRASSARAPAHAAGQPGHVHERGPAPPSPSFDRTPSAALPADPAQRERALLLRAFESSTLSKANFCALKRMTEAQLDAALAQARAERG